MSDTRLPVTVVGGYLGAGKTTLINHLLREGRRPIAVLVNDFGDLDVDASLITSNDGDVVSFANGCVCCDLSDGLIAALDRIRALPSPPDRVLIEASGVGELATIANYASLPGLRLDATVCVVDATTVDERANDRWVGDLVRAQLRAADLIACTKTDLLDEREIAQATARITAIAPGAVVLDVVDGAIDVDMLFDGFDQRGGIDRDHGHSVDASSTFVSWVRDFDAPIALDELRIALDALPASIARVKGVVRVIEGESMRNVLVQVVGRRREVLDASAEMDRTDALVFIAVRAEFDADSMPALLSPPPSGDVGPGGSGG